jgi:hypothetical protein
MMASESLPWDGPSLRKSFLIIDYLTLIFLDVF